MTAISQEQDMIIRKTASSNMPACRSAARHRQVIACAAAAACAAVIGSASAASVNFGGRAWSTGNGQGYTAAASTGTMTGQFAQDAVFTTPLTLNVGDVISYDSALSSGGWFSNTGFGFIDNTGLYDSAHDAYHGGKVERRGNSTWEFYALDPSNTQQAYWYLPNNPGDNTHYDWVFDNALHVQVTMKAGGNAPVTTGFDISDIADIKAFKA